MPDVGRGKGSQAPAESSVSDPTGEVFEAIVNAWAEILIADFLKRHGRTRTALAEVAYHAFAPVERLK